jgi:hypothetical protein
MFANDCLPYKDGDSEHKREFTAYTKEIRQRAQNEIRLREQNLPLPRNALDLTIRNIFTSSIYNTTQAEICHQRELIVKLGEMVAQYGADGLLSLEAQIPDVLRYYRTVFLPALEIHTKKCLKKATGGWPLDLPIN